MKVTINLNPKKKSFSQEILQRLGAYIPLAGAAAVVMLVLILSLQVFILAKTRDYEAHTKERQNWASEIDLLKQVQDRKALLQAEKKELEALMVPEYEAAAVFNDIFLSLPKNIWFESLKFKQGFIVLEGYVVRWHEDSLVSLDKFINALRKQKYFTAKFNKVNIKKSQKVDFNGAQTLQFIIECKN
ncbi:MAG: hypothetical protein ABIH08_02025 [Candidatus Omnitrophota bacterium]